jgi:transposase
VRKGGGASTKRYLDALCSIIHKIDGRETARFIPLLSRCPVLFLLSLRFECCFTQELLDTLDALLRVIESLDECIKEYGWQIEQNAKGIHSEIARLKLMRGVETLIVLTNILTLDDPHRFRRSRDVGRHLGLYP